MALCNTDIKQRFFNVRSLRMWNSLSSSVVNARSLQAFKFALSFWEMTCLTSEFVLVCCFCQSYCGRFY